MVKLDNWQTKAEKAAERRQASKQKKQQRDKTRWNKSLAQQLMAFFQEHNDAILRNYQALATQQQTTKHSPRKTTKASKEQLEIHIWTDQASEEHPFYKRCFALSSECMDDADFDRQGHSTRRKGRPRSNSYNDGYLANTTVSSPSSPSPSKKKGRNRSNSDASQTGRCSNSTKKKGRPRSNSNALEDSNSPSTQLPPILPPLCANHFFGTCSLASSTTGKSGGRRKVHPITSCPQCLHGWHPSEKQGNSTLSDIIGTATENEALQASLNAVLETSPSKSSDGMAMLFHSTGWVNPSEEENCSISEVISQTLGRYECSLGSIVYLSIGNRLVFDRNRDGMILSTADEEALLFGGSKRRSISIGSAFERSKSSISTDTNTTAAETIYSSISDKIDEESVVDLHQRLVQYLPSHVLEYILTFLPDSAVALVPQVCQSWNVEIGKSSPDLWKFLMERNGWPHQHVLDAKNDTVNITEQYRNAFYSHYTAIRDTKAMLRGFQDFLLDDMIVKEGNTGMKDVATFDFADISGGRCISGTTCTKMWSSNRVLVGSSQDCTLHLYDIIESSKGSGKRCKQSDRVFVAPFPSTKKRSCELSSVCLDDENVACLCSVLWSKLSGS